MVSTHVVEWQLVKIDWNAVTHVTTQGTQEHAVLTYLLFNTLL